MAMIKCVLFLFAFLGASLTSTMSVAQTVYGSFVGKITDGELRTGEDTYVSYTGDYVSGNFFGAPMGCNSFDLCQGVFTITYDILGGPSLTYSSDYGGLFSYGNTSGQEYVYGSSIITGPSSYGQIGVIGPMVPNGADPAIFFGGAIKGGSGEFYERFGGGGDVQILYGQLSTHYLSIPAVPEPSTLMMVLLGGAALLITSHTGARRRKRSPSGVI